MLTSQVVLKCSYIVLYLTSIIYCQRIDQEKKLQPLIKKPDSVYVGEYITGPCSQDSMKRLPMQLDAIRCKTRPKIVYVASSNPSMIMHPQAVVVNRCEGHCMNSRSCIPTKIRRVNSTAIWITLPTGGQRNAVFGRDSKMCGEIEVEEHLACACKCTIQQQHCNSNQEYISSKCACECTNEAEMKACLSSKQQVWNRETCRCDCRQMQECSTGFEWIPTRCGCGRVMEMEGERLNDMNSSEESQESDFASESE